jgi:hypothetical protein
MKKNDTLRPTPLQSCLSGVACALVTLTFAACGTNSNLKTAQAKYRSGNFSGALSTIRSEASKQKVGDRDACVVRLEHASMAFTAGQKDEAVQASRSADEAIKHRDEKAVVLVSKEASALLTNLNAIPYNTSPTERVMGASLLATTFAASGDLIKARSAVTLAKQRQKDNFGKFAAQIETERKSLSQAMSSSGQMRLQLQQDKIDGTMHKLESSTAKLQPYANYTVPYAEVMAGILLGAGPNPEASRSRDSFAMAKAANPASTQIQKAMSSPLNGTTHIFVEEGVAPHLGSLRIDLPLFINKNMVMFSAAFPTFEPNPLTSRQTTILSGGKAVDSDVICEFDRLAAAEYRQKMPATVSRTVAASALKSMISYVGQEAIRSQGKNGDSYAQLFALASGVYNVASAQADQRIWATLPKQVRYAVVPTPANGQVEINGTKVTLPKDGSTKVIVARSVNGQLSTQAFGL